MTVILSRKGGGSGGAAAGVTSIAESGQAALTGAVTLSEGAGIALTQVGQDIEIAAIGGSGLATLFDSTLGVAAASIDTGAGGIAGTALVLEVWIIARTSEAAETSSVQIRFNADAGANYDVQRVLGQDTTASATASVAATSLGVAVCGANAHAGAASVIRLTIPGYTQTTFHKAGEMTDMLVEDTAGNNRADMKGFRWRNTAAITRMAVAAGSGNLAAGSRLLIMGIG